MEGILKSASRALANASTRHPCQSSTPADSSCVSSLSQVLNEFIWNNKSIRRDGRPLYRNKIKNKGILRLGDILTLSGYKLKSLDQMKRKV